jgi:hypothetical protein
MLPGDAILRLTWAVACEFSGQPQQAQSILAALPTEKTIQAPSTILLVQEEGSGLKVGLRKLAAVQERVNVAVGMLNILPSVVVEIGEARSPADQQPVRLAQPRRDCDILPQQVSLVMVDTRKVSYEDELLVFGIPVDVPE